MKPVSLNSSMPPSQSSTVSTQQVKSKQLITRVVNIKYEEYDVYIGRPSKWGNPFVIGKDGTREEVVEKHRQMLLKSEELLAQLHELKGKRLGCFCKEKTKKQVPCHGDNYVELLEGKDAVYLRRHKRSTRSSHQ